MKEYIYRNVIHSREINNQELLTNSNGYTKKRFKNYQVHLHLISRRLAVSTILFSWRGIEMRWNYPYTMHIIQAVTTFFSTTVLTTDRWLLIKH